MSSKQGVLSSTTHRKYTVSVSEDRALLSKDEMRTINRFVETTTIGPGSGAPSCRIPDLPFDRVQQAGDSVLQMAVHPIRAQESALDVPLRYAAPEALHAPPFEDPPSHLPLSRRIAALLKGAESAPLVWTRTRATETAVLKEPSTAQITALKDAEMRAQAAQRSGNVVTAANLYSAVGCLNYNYGNLELAIKAFNKALVHFETLGDAPGLAFCHNVLGVSHYRLGAHKTSLVHYKKQEPLGTAYNRAVAQINMGVSYAALDELEFAEQAFTDGLSSANESGETMLETIAYGNLGLLCIRIGNMRGAQSNLEQCLENCSVARDKGGAAICLLLLGEVYSLIHDHQHALFYYEHAYRMGGEANNPALVDAARVSIGIARGNAAIRNVVLQQAKAMGCENDMTHITSTMPS